jgi:molybdate transport system substrate-binding protein
MIKKMNMNYKTMKSLLCHGSLVVWLLFLSACGPSVSSSVDEGDGPEVELLVFAAASTTNAVQDIAQLYYKMSGVKIVSSFASSSTLAKQIESGAPADVFISANPKWMDYLEASGDVLAGTRGDLLGNRIVCIAPAESELGELVVDANLDLSGLLGSSGRLAMGDPKHVPAGIYGQQALMALNLWGSVAERVAPMKDVRAALAIVERGETPLGIVYATDAAMSSRVKVVGVFPASSHPAIIYPVAQVGAATSEPAQAFLEFLKTPSAQAVFEGYGFSVVK